jgi:hypothetical protein
MKSNRYLLLTTLLALTTASTSFAQSRGKKFSFGLKAGANFSQLSDLSFRTPRLGADGLPVLSGGKLVYDFFQDNDARTLGVVGGVFARIGNRVFIQPELLLSAKGGKFDLVREGLATQRLDVKLTTIDIPLLLGFRLGPLRLNAGPLASLTVSDNGSLKDALRQYTTQSFGETVRQAKVGYQAGGGLTLGGMQIDLRHEGSLDELSSLLTKNTATSEAGPLSRTSLWQVTVGFGF